MDDDQLLIDLQNLMVEIDAQTTVVKEQAVQMGLSPYEMRFADGSWCLVGLLEAKAQIIHAYVLLTKG